MTSSRDLEIEEKAQEMLITRLRETGVITETIAEDETTVMEDAIFKLLTASRDDLSDARDNLIQAFLSCHTSLFTLAEDAINDQYADEAYSVDPLIEAGHKYSDFAEVLK